MCSSMSFQVAFSRSQLHEHWICFTLPAPLALKYAAISASQALNHHFWLLQLFHCYQCCHVQRQGKLQAMKDTKGSNKAIKHTMKDQVKATMWVHEGQEAHPVGGKGSTSPKCKPQICGAQFGHQTLQQGPSQLDLDPAHHGATTRMVRACASRLQDGAMDDSSKVWQQQLCFPYQPLELWKLVYGICLEALTMMSSVVYWFVTFFQHFEAFSASLFPLSAAGMYQWHFCKQIIFQLLLLLFFLQPSMALQWLWCLASVLLSTECFDLIKINQEQMIWHLHPIHWNWMCFGKANVCLAHQILAYWDNFLLVSSLASRAFKCT